MNSTEAHKIWLQKQRDLEPLLPIRLMAELLGTNSHSQVQEYLQDLVRRGLAREVKTGGVNRYRMISEKFAYKHKQEHE